MKLNKLAAVNPRRTSLGDDVEITFVPMASVSDSGHLMTPETRVYKDVKKGFTYFIENDILIAKITPCFENGKRFLAQNLMNEHGVGSTEFHVIRPNQNSNNRFIFYYLSLEHVNSRGRDFMSGSGGQQRVPADFYIQLGTPVPTLPEQQKIADCLSSLDDLIAVESEKLETLKVHKKGLMQELFPREDETVPRLRFPEFEGSGEWEVKRLGELLVKPPDYGVNAPSVPFSSKLPAYLRITDIDVEGNLRKNERTSVDLEVTSQNVLKTGDIVVARTGASVGKSYQYKPTDGQLVFAGFLIRLSPDPKKLDSTFIANYMTSRQYWSWVSVTSVRSGQPGINAAEYSSFAMPLPLSLSEQQKIASVLSSLDDRITAQSERIEALKNHKKGLMQRLFPVMEG